MARKPASATGDTTAETLKTARPRAAKAVSTEAVKPTAAKKAGAPAETAPAKSTRAKTATAAKATAAKAAAAAPAAKTAAKPAAARKPAAAKQTAPKAAKPKGDLLMFKPEEAAPIAATPEPAPFFAMPIVEPTETVMAPAPLPPAPPVEEVEDVRPEPAPPMRHQAKVDVPKQYAGKQRGFIGRFFDALTGKR